MKFNQTYIYRTLNQTLDDAVRMALQAKNEDTNLANAGENEGAVDNFVQRVIMKCSQSIRSNQSIT